MFEKQDNKLFVRADLLLAIVIAVCATVFIMHLTSSELAVKKPDSIVKWGQVDDSPGYLDAAERRRMNRIFGP